MSIVKIKSRFVARPTPEQEKKGWQNNEFYDIKIKQEGEKFLVKQANDTSKPSRTLLELNNFDEFVNHFTVHYKYIL